MQAPGLLGMPPGLAAGVLLVSRVDPQQARMLACYALLLVGTLTLAAPSGTVRLRDQSIVGGGLGFSGSVLGGLAAIPGSCHYPD